MTTSGDTDYSILDRPEVLRYLFFPRPDLYLSFSRNDAVSLSVPVAEEVTIDGQFHGASLGAPNILFFHGNGEIVSDYNDVAPFYTERGLNFIPVGYRGYGHSTGCPTVAALMGDCHKIFVYVRDWLREKGYTGPIIIMGRSLGSAPALELAKHYEDQIGGLIIESGFAYIEPLLALMGIDAKAMGITDAATFQNIKKIGSFHKPTLVIHAQYDHIIALAEGKALYEACPAEKKRFLLIGGANHNNVFVAGMNEYMRAIEWLVGCLQKRMNRGSGEYFS